MGRGLTWGFTFNGPDGINARIRRGELDEHIKLKFSNEGGATLTIPQPPPRQMLGSFRAWDQWVTEWLETGIWRPTKQTTGE
jgi:hypothetical protein